MKDGGRLVPDSFVDEIVATKLSYRTIFSTDGPTYRRPTFLQRMRGRWSHYRYLIRLAWDVLRDRHECY